MSLQIEKLEKNMAKLTITVVADEFDEALKKSYNKNKVKFAVPGFRKGKATQAMVEKHFGVHVLYEDALDFCIDASYPKAVKESELDIVSRPSINIVNIAKGQDLIYEASVALKPSVKLGEYKGVEIEKADTTVTPEDIEKALKQEQERNARLVAVEDRAVQDGDHTVIDFDGRVGDVHFEGGKAEDYSLVIGSHSFIEGFEEQLIGHKLMEEFDINVTFPENYHSEELKGKDATFTVKIKEIKYKELPELDDDFASEVSEFDTLEEYKTDISKKLSEEKEKQAIITNERVLLDKIRSNASMEVPEPMIEGQVEQMVQDYAKRIESQGLPFDQYMQFTGMTIEKLKEQMKPQAISNIETRLTLEAIVKEENIVPSDEDVEDELKRIAENYKMDIDKIKGFFVGEQEAQLKMDLSIQKAIKFLVENAKMI